MNNLKDLLQELGISKVKLAKYLGVSRQMVYNYLNLDSLDKWPKEKKLLLLQLLNIKEGDNKTFKNIKVTTEYLRNVENKLNLNINSSTNIENFLDIKGLNKNAINLLSDIIFWFKDQLYEENNDTNITLIKYIYYMLQSIEKNPEIKYILAYLAKTNGFVKPNEFAFNEEKQFTFEGIFYLAFTIYNSEGASQNKIIEYRKKFLEELERKNEEELGRTQQLTTIKIQALNELGYMDINNTNAKEVFDKMAEIEARNKKS